MSSGYASWKPWTQRLTHPHHHVHRIYQGRRHYDPHGKRGSRRLQLVAAAAAELRSAGAGRRAGPHAAPMMDDDLHMQWPHVPPQLQRTGLPASAPWHAASAPPRAAPTARGDETRWWGEPRGAEEFAAHFGGLEEWDAARPLHPPPAAPTRAAPCQH
eukprot:gene47875-63783_t